jgi:CRISPR-associated Csx10 family RAMP protein
MQLRTHTGINYRTGTVQEAILYSRQGLKEGQTFWGQWWIDDDLWPAFETFVTEASQSGSVRLGTSRSRGAGGVTCNLARKEDDPIDALRQRVEDWHHLLKAAADEAAIPATAALYVPLLCYSHVVLHDPLGRARLQIHGEDLAAVGLGEASLVFHSASVVHVQSWSSLWGLPKADDWAIGMGSVFLLALPRADDATFAALWQLQQQGVGLRRAEGFGIVSVANQVHLDLAGGQLR